MKKRLLDIIDKDKLSYPNTCAIVKNQLTGFLDDVEEDVQNCEILGLKSKGEGRRTYERTLAFLSAYVARQMNPNYRVEIKHSYGDALYGEIEGIYPYTYIDEFKTKLKQAVSKNLQILKQEFTKEEIIEKLRQFERQDDIRLIKYLSKERIPVYTMDDYFAYFAGPLLPYTGMLKVFDVVPYPPGFLIVLPASDNPDKLATIPDRVKLFKTFQESKKWVNALGIKYVGDLNDLIAKGDFSEIIKIQETMHEKKISQIADAIYEKKDVVKIVLIAGPSSSGKTTFAKRLRIHLRADGLTPRSLSTDNYFVDREKTPLDENGNPDFDSFDAIEHALLQEHLRKLIKGESITIPKFDFHTGKKRPGAELCLGKNDILIVEGIHGLNPQLTSEIPAAVKFKIYVSALTQLNIDSVNRIPTREARLIRRIVRDRLFRGHSALRTIRMWPSVLRGEEKYIFPFQEEADIMFNSALVHELAVLKGYAEPFLRVIDSSEREYADALRLLNFLSHFMGIMPAELPPTSIIREFIGGSSFRY